MATKPWSDEENALLRSCASSAAWQVIASALMPTRSADSLNSQMTRIRRELGIKRRAGRKSADDWQDNARDASARLAEATLAVGRWS